MPCVEVEAPAKVNLFLRVLGRRGDGYHELETVFFALSLSDRVTLRETGSGLEVRADRAGVPSGQSNLCYRAASLLWQRAIAEERGRARQALGLRVHITKRIPVGAGLGGGSSDAAATLVGLNRLWDLGFSLSELEAAAAQVGSDVPFCLRGGTALGRGRGERLEPLPAPPPAWLVVAEPGFRVSTPVAYAWLDQLRSAPPRGARGRPPRPEPAVGAMVEALRSQDLRLVAAALYNSFEAAVLPRYPLVARIRDALLAAGALGALMSGSGPAVFALAADESSAAVLARSVQGLARRVFVVPATQAVPGPGGKESPAAPPNSSAITREGK
ncbi:MAG: 4-(cytidine 5'-diphospho)-2-C-methyl-D-erythritol kinase [Acetobacteraceae bacterium]|nr:4-(cytidine 5'-diphospho)-2-C-methyl-D-erythritol kinase [Acetobacteraceae bacterium]